MTRYEGTLSVVEMLKGEIVDPYDLTQTQARGHSFLAEQKACLLRVPSVIVKYEYNYVFNPLHPEASRLQPVENLDFTFDNRLLKPVK